jgi:hypothetical protein
MLAKERGKKGRMQELLVLQQDALEPIQSPTTASLVSQGEIVLGTFSSEPVQNLPTYSIVVTDKRIMGIKIQPGGVVSPRLASEVDESSNITIDFSILRGAVASVMMKNLGKNRNVFLFKIRGGVGRNLKILLKHSSDIELRREKELFIEGFSRQKGANASVRRRSSKTSHRGSPEWRKKLSDSLRESWEFRKKV